MAAQHVMAAQHAMAAQNAIKGRGATFSPPVRFDAWTRERACDEPTGTAGQGAGEEPGAKPVTFVTRRAARSIISRNDSPDIPFEQSINPYQGCEHGCIYCYARPSHAYLGLSPGLDFETRIFAKTNAAELLRRELAAPGYVCKPITLGGNTDPYQPAERELRVTRSVIEVLAACSHPFSVITKSALIERDIDLMAPMARAGLVQACVSVTNRDADLARRLEPRASAPHRRIESIRRLADAGIPVAVMVAPVIPFITDCHLEEILQSAREAGATSAGYVLLRLPLEVGPLFRQWLQAHYPLKARHVMSLVQQMRGGRDYDTRWGVRQRGVGPLADVIEKRFAIACRRLGLDRPRLRADTGRFVPPRGDAAQMALF